MNIHSVVNIGPLRMMVHGLRQQRYLTHEIKGFDKILEDEMAVKLVVVQAPVGEPVQFLLNNRSGTKR